MGKYMVYTRIQNIGDDKVQEIMVMNVESTSCGGAEHKILDNCPCIGNALAWDIEDSEAMKFAIPYLTSSKCFDIKDFMIRYRKMEQARQEAIDEVLDEIEEVKEEIRDKQAEINRMELEIEKFKASIKADNDYIVERYTDLNDYCHKARMRAVHSKVDECVIGIA